MLPPGADGFHVQDVPHRQRGREHLPQHGGHGGAHHAPAAAEDEYRVQHDVHQGACQGGAHGKSGIAVGADDGVHGLPEHIKGNAQGDIKEIFLRAGKGLLIDGAAEQGDEGRLKQQVQGRQHHTSGDAHLNGVAHAVFGGVLSALAQAKADKGTAAIPHHDRDGQRHHREGEHHRVGRVAVGAQITGVGNEDLVHDVIQRPHQQRDDAGHRIPAHQLAHGLGAQKLV